MFLKFIKRSAMLLLLIFTAYLAIGYIFHLVIFPEKKPSVSSYFKPGDELYSKREGVRQTVVKQEDGIVHCMSEFEPYAPGPPAHVHIGFDETFKIKNGELSIWVDGKVVKLRPGDSVHIPIGTPHKPFNETSDTVHTDGLVAFPEKFAYHLGQVYGIMDNDPSFGKSPKTLLQMSLFSTEGFDSYLVEGPPVGAQRVLGFLLTPLTRLFGYRSFYQEYNVTKNDELMGSIK